MHTRTVVTLVGVALLVGGVSLWGKNYIERALQADVDRQVRLSRYLASVATSTAYLPSLPETGSEVVVTSSRGVQPRVRTPATIPTPEVVSPRQDSVVHMRAFTEGLLAVSADTKNIPMIRFSLVTPEVSGLLLTDIAIGAPAGNTPFNFVENMRLVSLTGAEIPLIFQELYVAGYPLWKLKTPVDLSSGGTIPFAMIADLKPGVATGTRIVPLVANKAVTNLLPTDGVGLGRELIVR